MENVAHNVAALSSSLEYSQYYRCNFRGYFEIQNFFLGIFAIQDKYVSRNTFNVAGVPLERAIKLRHFFISYLSQALPLKVAYFSRFSEYKAG